MKFLLFSFIILFLSSAHAKVWIGKNTDKSIYNFRNCTHELLNPNLGADIFKINCPTQKKIENVEENIEWKIFNSPYIAPNDERLSDQWGLELMNVPLFWQNFSVGNSDIKVAVIDTGINYLHPDLQNNLAANTKEIPDNGIDDDNNGYIDDYYGWNAALKNGNPMDKFFHGTHVAGIIGASSNNEIGIVGINWKVSLIPIKFVDDEGGGSTETAIRAIDYAVLRGVKIINASWGGPKSSPLLEEVISRCRDKGILFIAAAGNETTDNDKVPSYPANYQLDNIISVASIDLHKDLSWFSNWGAKTVHVAAPGESILSTVGGSRYGFKDGTSMAVPHISGAAALLWSIHPDWDYRQIKNYILGHCQVDKKHDIPVICQGYFSF